MLRVQGIKPRPEGLGRESNELGTLLLSGKAVLSNNAY